MEFIFFGPISFFVSALLCVCGLFAFLLAALQGLIVSTRTEEQSSVLRVKQILGLTLEPGVEEQTEAIEKRQQQLAEVREVPLLPSFVFTD